MKKILCLLTIAVLLFSLTACSDSGSGSDSSSSSSSASSSAVASSKKDSDSSKTGKIDVDLTKMSATMVYSEVLNMNQTPLNYLGKTVRMEGAFSVVEANNNRYFACIIKDATACCAQGIEFTWAGSHSYPDDYPEENEDITVTGTFSTYKEGEQTYIQLKDSEVEF